MVGHGETKENALECLRNHFDLYKKNNTQLPRPGAFTSLKFASTIKIDEYEKLAADFFKRILDSNYYAGFYSDECMLHYLELLIEEDNKKPKEIILQRVKDNYNVDISSIYHESLWKTLEMISNKLIL